MMESKEYDKAKEKYNLAIAIRPDEKYPQDKLRKLNPLFSSGKTIQESYNKLIAEADDYFNKQEYEQAKIKYQNALKYKPDESYPVQKLGEIEGLVSDLETLKRIIPG